MSPDVLEPGALAAAFFGPGNGYAWDGPDRPRIQAWVDDLRHPGRPVFLPRRLADGRVRWYALARSSRQARDLSEQLVAFLGPTYSDFDGRTAALDPDDPVEAALIGSFAAVFALTVVRPEDAGTAEALLNQLRHLLALRPRRTDDETPTLGRLIREFDLALRASDGPAAERVLADLRTRGELASHKLGWLKVRLLASRGQWREALDLPELPELLARPRPAAVTEALQEAVYHVHLERFESETWPADAVAYFRAELIPTYGVLFRTLRSNPTGPAGRAAAVAATAVASPEPPAPTPGAVAVPAPSAEELARRAMGANDYGTAYRLLLDLPPTAAGLELLLHCASDRGDSPVIAQEVIAVFDAAPLDVRETVLARRTNRLILDDLRGHVAPSEAPGPTAAAVPAGWRDWLDRLNRHGAWPKAAETARGGVRDWSIAAIRDDPAEQEEFVQVLAAPRQPAASAVLKNCIPQLLEVFLPRGVPDPQLKQVYQQLLVLVIFDEQQTSASSGVLLELTSALLECGLIVTGARNEYQELSEQLALGLEVFCSPVQFGRAVELLDLLAAHGVHRHADVIPLLQEIAAAFGRHSNRVTEWQWAKLQRACADFGHPELYAACRPTPPAAADEEDEDSRFRRQLHGRTVVLHTMDDRIATTFLNAMEQKFPATRFKVVKEKDDGQLLRDVARSADVYLLNTYDLPHSATGPVKKHRSGENTLYPAGKNASQQVEALYRWLRTGATSPPNTG
jgi:hypothetical protein